MRRCGLFHTRGAPLSRRGARESDGEGGTALRTVARRAAAGREGTCHGQFHHAHRRRDHRGGFARDADAGRRRYRAGEPRRRDHGRRRSARCCPTSTSRIRAPAARCSRASRCSSRSRCCSTSRRACRSPRCGSSGSGRCCSCATDCIRSSTASRCHRGIWHSLIAGLACGFATAIVFYYVLEPPGRRRLARRRLPVHRLLTHLMLDEIYSVDVMGNHIKKSFGTALKLIDLRNPAASAAMAVAAVALLFLVAADRARSSTASPRARCGRGCTSACCRRIPGSASSDERGSRCAAAPGRAPPQTTGSLPAAAAATPARRRRLEPARPDGASPHAGAAFLPVRRDRSRPDRRSATRPAWRGDVRELVRGRRAR